MHKHIRPVNVHLTWFKKLRQSLPVNTLVSLVPSRIGHTVGISPVVGEDHGIGSTHGGAAEDLDAVV